MRRKVLQIDGGGILGIMPLAVLCEIEDVTAMPCYKQFDLMSGTSTGSIICGMLAAGVPARELYNLYVDNGKKLFKSNGWFGSVFGSKYDRSDLMATMYAMVKKYGAGPNMGNCRTQFISTAFNRTSGRTHFQMSWDNYHRGLDLVQVIAWSSLSAVEYFGPIAVPDYQYTVDYQVDVPYPTKGAVFYDGGQGRNNCTLNECITTCDINNYYDNGNEVHILSLGCGDVRLAMPYDQCVKQNKIAAIKDVISEARNEGVYDQLNKAYTTVGKHKDLHVYRMDVVIKDDENVLDALDKIPNFVAYGQKLKLQIPDIFK